MMLAIVDGHQHIHRTRNWTFVYTCEEQFNLGLWINPEPDLGLYTYKPKA